jgi:adenine-specific DNA methylase
MKLPPYFAALPSYPGGKRALNNWIFKHLSETVPRIHWPNLTFIDAFSGGGAVSMQAKLSGFQHVVSNDFSDRSQLVLRGLIDNHHRKLSFQSVYPLTQPQTEPGFVREHFAGSVFSLRHTQALDGALSYIQQVPDPVMQALLRLLLWKRVVRYVAFGTSIGTSNRPFAEALDGKRPFSELNPKRLQDGSLAHLLEPCWQGLERDISALNKGIFPAAGHVNIHQKDAFTLLPDIQGDILYLDPPYADTLGYSKANEVLDAVLFGRLPEKGESVFTDRVDAISDLLDISRHIPVWVLSYNDKVLGLDALRELVNKVDPHRRVEGFAKPYAHLPHVAKRENQELLMIASKG